MITVVLGRFFCGIAAMEHCVAPRPVWIVNPILVLSFLGLSTFSVPAGRQDEWPNWRGPNGNGSIDRQVSRQMGRDHVLWKVALPGKGGSTPIVRDERIYLTAPAGGQDAVLAFDFSGRQLWQTKLGHESPPKHRTLGSSANASPVTDGKGLFVYFRSGNFAALEFDGTVRWKINLVERFGRDQLFWDQGTSPVVTEQHVVMVRHARGRVVARRLSTRPPANCAGSRRGITRRRSRTTTAIARRCSFSTKASPPCWSGAPTI